MVNIELAKKNLRCLNEFLKLVYRQRMCFLRSQHLWQKCCGGRWVFYMVVVYW